MRWSTSSEAVVLCCSRHQKRDCTGPCDVLNCRNASGQRLPAPGYAVMTGYAVPGAGPWIFPAWGLAGGIAATLVIGKLVGPCRAVRASCRGRSRRSPPVDAGQRTQKPSGSASTSDADWSM
jgi:hypothetical protein